LYNIGLSSRPLPTEKSDPGALADGYEHYELSLTGEDRENSKKLGIFPSLRFDRLDRYLPTDKRLDVMKVDIEGYEQNAIESGLPTFRETGAPLTVLAECDRRFSGHSVAAINQDGHKEEVRLGTYFWGAFSKEFGCVISSVDLPFIHGWFYARWRLVGWSLLKMSSGSNVVLDCSNSLTFGDYCLFILILFSIKAIMHYSKSVKATYGMIAFAIFIVLHIRGCTCCGTISMK
jgi:hypothetical protein